MTSIPLSALVSLDEIRAASARLNGVAVRTPLIPSPLLSETVGGEVRLKVEAVQRTGSFKFRGAFNFIALQPPQVVAPGVITYSSGNHAQAVALAARLHGISATVVMPTSAPVVKREGAEALGARVVLEGTTSLERKHRAEAIQSEEGLLMVPPFDDPHIIAGQGTTGMEVVADWPEVDTWVVCIGGGGLGAGSAAAIRALSPNVRVIGVEPEGAAAMRRSLDTGEPVTLERIDTIADGLAPVRPGDLTFAHIEALFDDMVTVSDDEIRDAARFLIFRQKLLVEFSGAATTAALLYGKVPGRGRRTALMVSGGNMDPALLRTLV